MMPNKNSVFPSLYPVAAHTDNVGNGTTFVAITGMRKNGIDYIPLALQKGATRIIIDTEINAEIQQLIKAAGAQLDRVKNARRALAIESARALEYPASKLKIFGITGTKGKTTTSFLLHHFFKHAGYQTALISSAGNYIGSEFFPAVHATPQPDYLHVFLDLCVKQGITHVVMEVAAQALSCSRVEGINFEGVIFTNFSREHGEFYKTQDDYFKAKCMIFTQLKPDASVFLNADDQAVANIALDRPVVYFSAQQVNAVQESLNGMSGTLSLNGKKIPFSCPTLIGSYNLSNILGAISLAHRVGISEDVLERALGTFGGVPGRLNPQEAFLLSSGAYAFIDKAHNPSSYEAVLSVLRTLTSDLIVLFGAGGERDKGKRPIMGAIAAQYADCIILTSDDPRSENPHDIIDDIAVGINSKAECNVEVDREKAIVKACELAKAGSIIAILGKGPDEYQLVSGVKHHFSEREILSRFLVKKPVKSNFLTA